MSFSFDRHPSAVQLVQSLLGLALERGASDVHLVQDRAGPQVLLRLDGVLSSLPELQAPLRVRYDEVVARIKLMADMDIAEHRLPQDGSLLFRVGDSERMMRVSTLPANHGERLVLRVLGQQIASYQLTDIALPGAVTEALHNALQRPQGMVLVTGPTGSGKTTTLYACLHHLRDRNLCTLTAEDPVEVEVPGISQVQVMEAIGRDFARLLRAFLRQDPDVLMIGEIRDTETANTSVRASLTGHLVLSTLHTQSAPGAVVRLLDMGVEPYLVSASLDLVISQRLLRRLCSVCHGEGCDQCSGTGYCGRVPVCEWLSVSDAIRQAVLHQGGTADIASLAAQDGYRPLSEQGRELVAAGITSELEYHRVIGT